LLRAVILNCELLESSGVADAEPLAASLAAAGFRLASVAVVVDAEAGLAVLQQEVAVAQVRGRIQAGFKRLG
jgi:G3E family GTPase